MKEYDNKMVNLFHNPENVGSMDTSDPNVGTGIVGAPSCGDVLKLQIKVKDGVVIDAKFKTYGCGSAIASSSYATTLLMGKNISEAYTIKDSDIASHLLLPPIKLHCSVLAEQAIRAALEDYYTKNPIESSKPETAD